MLRQRFHLLFFFSFPFVLFVLSVVHNLFLQPQTTPTTRTKKCFTNLSFASSHLLIFSSSHPLFFPVRGVRAVRGLRFFSFFLPRTTPTTRTKKCFTNLSFAFSHFRSSSVGHRTILFISAFG
jgi:hypothetical protein